MTTSRRAPLGRQNSHAMDLVRPIGGGPQPYWQKARSTSFPLLLATRLSPPDHEESEQVHEDDGDQSRDMPPPQ
jgi:hypothetical protein